MGVPYQNRPAHEDPSGHDLKDVHQHGVTGNAPYPGSRIRDGAQQRGVGKGDRQLLSLVI
jgi:hypothetical protein